MRTDRTRTWTGAARPGRGALVAAAVTATAAYGCGSDEVGIPVGAVSVRDSAGVRVVESTGSTWANGEAWEIDPEPTVQIGTVGGDDAYLFGFVTVARRLADGTILVVDLQAKTIRAYGPDGLHRSDWATEGEGPGEVRNPRDLIRLPGDSVAVGEFGGILSVFGPDGTFLRRINLPTDVRSREELEALGDVALTNNPRGVVGALGAGEYLVRFRGTVSFGDGQPERTPLIRSGEDGSREVLVTLESGSYDAWAEGPMGRRAPVHFPPWLGIAMHPGGFVASTGETYGVTYYAADGSARTVARLIHPRVAVDQSVKDRWRENRSQWWGRSPEPGVPAGRLQQAFEETPYPDSVPALGELHVDLAGNVWAQEYWVGWEDSPPARHYVFAPDGAFLGTVDAPDGLRITEVGDDYVLGVWEDENEVDFVRMHRLVKPR